MRAEGLAGQASGGAPAAASRKLVLIGFMGAGKTTAARRLAERVGAEAVDTDALIEARLGEPIASFFDREGESAFREHERALVLELLERPGPAVLALGGGAVESEAVREGLAGEVCVFLDVDPEQAWRRSRDSGRPLARDRGAFTRLHAGRLSIYEALARAVLPASTGPPDSALDATARLAAPGVPDTVQMVWAPTQEGGYPVYVGEGALDSAGALWPLGGRVFAVADEGVQLLHGERLSGALAAGPGVGAVITVPAGEEHKTMAEAERVLRALAGAGMERSDAIVAFGGGVTGDLAGFCAAIYQRGVGIVHVPTTLVAQVDSAYGGKTGVDLPEAKNYAGAFHQPAAVFTDPAVLSTLPPAELRAGFAEVVKTALIAGGPLWDQVRALPPIARALDEHGAGADLAAVTVGCLRAKLAVVAKDERDTGARAALNLGHTFAHALEAATGYSGYRHGEAVAVGLLVALRLSERELELAPAVREEVVALLERHGLPRSFGGPSSDELLRHAALDKKRRGGRANLVLLRAPGQIVAECDVAEEAFAAAIEEVREK